MIDYEAYRFFENEDDERTCQRDDKEKHQLSKVFAISTQRSVTR